MRLDGELWLGRGRFEQTLAAVQRAHEATWAHVKYMVFDAPAAGGGFVERLAAARERVGCRVTPFGEVGEGRVQLAGTTPCEDATRVAVLLEKIRLSGGEGLILRRASSRFLSGQNGDLVKVKPCARRTPRLAAHRAATRPLPHPSQPPTRVPYRAPCTERAVPGERVLW